MCHRARPKGPPLTEVWALREFGPRECILPGTTTQIKEGLWTQSSSVFLAVPQAGPGKHPEGKLLALDGRGRSSMASREMIDSQERRGTLFWTIPRTSKKDEANLVIEQVPWSTSVGLKLPLPKKRKCEVNWASENLPPLPVLVNAKTIKAHSRLLVFVDPPSSRKAAAERASEPSRASAKSSSSKDEP